MYRKTVLEFKTTKYTKAPAEFANVTVLLLTEKLFFFVLIIADLDDVMLCKVCVM